MDTRYSEDSDDYDSSYEPERGDEYDERRWSGRRGFGDRFFDFVRTRRTEHWVMFAAGLVIGAILG